MASINVNGKTYEVKTKKGMPWSKSTGVSYYTDDEGIDRKVTLNENREYVTSNDKASWVTEKEKSGNIFKTAAQNLQRQGEELRQKNDAEVEAIKKAKDEGKKVETDPTTGETLVNGKSVEVDKTPVQEVEKAEEKKAEKTSDKKEEPKTEEVKEPETPKEEEPKAEEKTPEQVAKEDTEAVQADNKAASDLLERKIKFSNYRSSAHASTIGAIFSPDSGLTIGERVSMGLNVMGKIIGSVLMANGMSLLGDNSYFSKIGEGVDLDSLTTEEQKKFTDEMNNAMIETAKKAKRAEQVFDSNIAASNVELDKKQRDFALSNINTYATMSDENAQKDLIAKGFTPEQAQVTVQALKRTVKENPELLKAKADVRTESQEEYKFTVEQFNNENALMQQIKVLKEEMLNVSKANAKDLIELASSIAGFYGTASEAQNKSKNFGWNVNADASIKFVASVSGGVQGASSSGESTSVSGFTEEGKAKALQAIEKMSNEELNQYKEALINSYKEAIEGIEQQIAALKKNRVNDAVIPNGEIESVNLKDGTTLNVNENDGAVLTTNPLPEGLLSFAEGEVNPFDYLGYDGDKKECEYYETIFDEKEMKCNSFDDALVLLE